MSETILNTLLQDTFTQTSLKHKLKILKISLLKEFFGSEGDTEGLSDEDINWLKSLSPSFYQQFNKDNVYDIFKQVEDKLENTPVLLIYVPFEATEQAIYQIGTILRKNFNGLYLFDTKLDPSLIAGCALSWKGVYRDYSLKARIEEKKGEILSSFKKYLR